MLSPDHPLVGAKWIASRPMGGVYVHAPAPYLRKSFSVSGPIESAQLFVTALGLYECELNGQRVGDEVFAPGWTDYAKRVQYSTHDVTGLMHEGENVLGGILGDGWYCGRTGWIQRQTYGNRPRFIARLVITLQDQRTLEVVSDESWKTTFGPILENDFMDGESYDARLELGNWSKASFDAKAWDAVTIATDSQAELVPRVGPPVRRMGEIAPVSQRDLSPGKDNRHIIYDLGQNFSGRVRLEIEAARGVTVILRFSEMLNPDGTLYTQSLRKARAMDYYTTKGEGLETWEPRFTFHGFRYVEARIYSEVQNLSVTGIVLHSDMATTGHFACSSPLLNQLQHNIVWGQKSNFLDVPTDCPQRDERLGWTGDAQVFIRTAAFNMDVRGFFHKWMQDVRDAQRPDGGVPPVVPCNCWSDDGGPAWADATIICPWTIYLCYGDKKILEDHYDSMLCYMDFLAEKRCLNGIREHPDSVGGHGFGDWLALDGSGKTEGITPKDLIGTAFHAYDAELMANISSVLGREAEAEKFRARRKEITEAFQRRFITPEGLIASRTQTSYVLALHFDLVPESTKAVVVRELVRLIEENNFHLATGFVGTPYILDVLQAQGHLDVAYKLLEQETFPSWLFPVKHGATTIWERWDGWTPEKGFQDWNMNSFNHYAYGAVGAWMVKAVAGLDLEPEEPGYRHIRFHPCPGGSLTWAEASLATPHGKAAIHWQTEGDELKLALTVPIESQATLELPAEYEFASRELQTGEHTLSAFRRKS